MEHIAIDLGSRESQVCVRSATNEILMEQRVSTRALRNLLKKRPASRVVLETSSEAFAIADQAIECGHNVRVVPSVLVRALGVGARGLKNDVRDSRVLSEASVRMELPSVHVPSQQSRELKSLCAARDALISSRTKLINNVRGFLRTQTITLRKGNAETFTRRLREKFELPDGEAEAPKKARRTARATRNEASAPKTPPTPPRTELPAFVAGLLQAIDALTVQIVALDQELDQFAQANSVCRRLMTIPGVGPVTATRFVAAVDTVERFPDATKLQSYVGLVPGEDQSGEKHRRTRLIKSGQSGLRWTLVQAAWSLYRTRKNDPIAQWAMGIEHRRGRKVAIVAIARKLASVMFALWRDGSEYTPGGVKPSKEPAMTN